MRLTQVASLFLAPALMAVPAVASSTKTDAPATAQTLRVSTGVTAPTLDAGSIRISPGSMSDAFIGQATVVLSLYVDEKGQAQSVRVVKSAGPDLDQRVVDGVLQAKFQPATLDHKAIPLEMSLIVRVQR
jgi:TonB family protein